MKNFFSSSRIALVSSRTSLPEDYGLILSLARRLANREVETQLRAEGRMRSSCVSGETSIVKEHRSWRSILSGDASALCESLRRRMAFDLGESPPLPPTNVPKHYVVAQVVRR
jgi:hypothetical protein